MGTTSQIEVVPSSRRRTRSREEPRGATRDSQEQRLERCFLLTNQLFFHRQVLDDLLDLDSDTEEGLAGTLHYLVVSQGRLAERLERLAAPRGMAELPAEARREVVGEVARSWLLPPHGEHV